MNPVTRTRLVMIAVAAVFLVPLLSALFLNSAWTDWAPGSTKNQGRLLQPPPELPDGERVVERGRWAVLRLTRDCDIDDCAAHAEIWQRLYRTTGRDMEKVTAALIVAEPVDERRMTEIEAVAPNVAVVQGRGDDWFARVGDALGGDPFGQAVIVDPRGYIALAYADANPRAVQKDLDRLLTWSKE